MNNLACEWQISGKSGSELGVDYLEIFTPVIPCSYTTSCREEKINNVTYVITNLTIINPIDYVVNASISCIPSQRIVSWHGFPKSK